MDHTRPAYRTRTRRAGPGPGPLPEPEPDPGLDAGDEPDERPDEDIPPARSQLLDQLYAQWHDGVADRSRAIVLRLTVPEDPRGGPYLQLLVGLPDDGTGDMAALWDETQRASDVTVVGQLVRPIVALEPMAGRWTVVRTTGLRSVPEPVDHADPLSALRAARVRYGEVLRMGGLATDDAAFIALMGLLDDTDGSGGDAEVPDDRPDPEAAA